ncbi:MAG: TonB-dependent receptor, partial [Sphingomonadaceae bacterium]
TIVNLPQLGPLSLKVSYLHDQIDGDVDNLLGGRTIDFSQRMPAFGTLTYADKLGGRNIDAVQVAARIDASDSLKIDYRFDYTDSNTVGRATQLLGVTGDATGAAVAPILAAQAFTGGITNQSYDRLSAVANATSNEHIVTQGHNLSIAWDVSDILTVKSITAYRKFKQDPNIYDLGSTGGLKVTGGANDSFFTLLTARSTSQKQFSQEAQFIFNWDNFDLTSGVFYFHENSPANNVLGIFETIINGTPANNGSITATRAVNDSIAGYGQLTWHATDQIDVAFGARYTIDDRATKLISVATGAGSGLVPGRTYKTSYEKLNYTGILTYRPNDDITTYAKIATGYVAGGILGAIPYGPESLTSYEAGVKSKLFGNRVRTNLAAFYSDYKDLQIQTFIGGVQRFENAGKARIWGIEAELQAAPIDGLTIDANLGYTNFKYKEYLQGGVNVADQVNITYTPKWTARLGGQYDFPEFANGGNFFINVDSRYRSSVPLTAFPTQNPIVDALAISKKHILTDVRAGVASLPIGGTAIGIS